MTRLLSMAVLAALVTNTCFAESPLLDAPVHILAQNDSDLPAPDRPSYESLLTELEEAKSRLADAEAELNALTRQSYSQDDHRQELQELREATGFHMDDAQLNREYHYDPPGKGDTPGPGGDVGDLGSQAQNPVGAMWMLWFQNDMKLLEGPLGGKRIFNTTVFQPVMPMQLTDKWRVINRPVITFNAFEVPTPFTFLPGGNQGPQVPPGDPFNTKWGLGDTIFAQYFSANGSDDKLLWGIGETWMFPTATEGELGTGKTSVGPAALAVYMGEKWIFGGIMQQWWSIGGADSKPRVSLMDIQMPLRYRINPMTSLGMAPNIQWDQVTGKWTVPLGFGFDSTTMATGGKPLRYGAEIYYYASHRENDFDPEWQFRMFFVPIIPSPDFAKNALFGGNKCRNGHSCRCHRCR
jgi:hypothetical protein